MRNYWSCTKFADWIRGNPKLKCGTSGEWRDWRKESKKLHPYRHWIAEELLDEIQNVIRWPLERLYDVKYYLNNRYITKTHALTSSLKRGSWHEFDTRILHCLFDELVNFVEQEKAWMTVAWGDEETRKKYNTPWYAFGWLRIRGWRCPGAGLDHLEWESKLRYDEEWMDKEDPRYGQLTPQALTAIETLELYNWWKVIRPQRTDPDDESGWSAHCAKRRETQDEDDILFDDRTPEEREESGRLIDLSHEIEKKYNDEDTEMLIRLIKIRRSLWT